MPQYRFDEIAINSTAKKKPTEADKDTYLGLEHLDSGNLTVTRFGSDVAPIGEKLLMRKGDVLFGKRRAYQKKVAIAPFDGIFSAHGMVLRPRTDVITTEFFPLFIASDYFLDAAIKISVGSLSPTINWSALKELVFNLPAIDEQRSLAGILWAMIDAKNAYMRLIEYTDELVKCQFVEMFGDKQIRQNNWQQVPISDILHQPISGEWGTEDTDGTGVRVLRTTNFTDIGDIDYSNVITRIISEDKYRSKVIKRHDIIIEKSGGSGTKPVGRVVLVKTELENYIVNNFTAILRIKNNVELNSRFVFQFLFNTYWDGGTKLFENKTTGIHNLKLLDYLQNTIIPLPPYSLQTRFADFVRHADKSKFIVFDALRLAEMYIKIVW